MGTFRSLRHRNYRLYFFGQMTSLVGSWMQSAAVTWLAYHLTRQSTWPAVLTAAQIGPTVLLGPWAGALADRADKGRLIIRTQTAFLLLAGALTALTYAGLANVWVLLAVMLVQGVVQAIDLPARLAFVPDLISRDDLINAVALNSVVFNVARTIGPALAGVMLVVAGPADCFLVNTVSYLAVLAALLAMQLPPGRRTASDRPPGRGFLAGFAVLRRQPRVLMLALLAGFTALCGWPLLALLPALADGVLKHAKEGYSTMLSAVGVGALAAGLVAATYGNEARRRRFLSGGALLVSVSLGLLSQAQHLSVAVACCGMFGFGMILLFATGQAAVQLSTNDENRGKVMGVWAMMLSGGAPVGNLLFGPAADTWGVTTVLMVQSLAMAGAAAVLLLRRGRRERAVNPATVSVVN